MENELQDSSKGRGSAIAWSLATILILLGMLVASALTFICHDKVSNLINPEKDNVEQVCVDTIYTEAVPTIQEVLQFREDTKRYMHIDSVFLTMPDVVLIDILRQHGTSLSNSDIVTIYESNRSTYNKVMSGARSQHYKDSLDKLSNTYDNTKDTTFVKRE